MRIDAAAGRIPSIAHHHADESAGRIEQWSAALARLHAGIRTQHILLGQHVRQAALQQAGRKLPFGQRKEVRKPDGKDHIADARRCARKRGERIVAGRRGGRIAGGWRLQESHIVGTAETGVPIENASGKGATVPGAVHLRRVGALFDGI